MRKLLSIVISAALLLIGSAQGTWAQKVYDLGTYPGGTWAEMKDISDSGVAVGAGDIGTGEQRPVGVPLFGSNAGQWFDLGTFSADVTLLGGIGFEIADTGMTVGLAATASAVPEEGYPHAFVWTSKLGAKLDLGTLPGDTCSGAQGVNKSGTLIVGFSHKHLGGIYTPLVGMQSPLVWTREVVWAAGGPTTTWVMHKLDTEGFDQPDEVVPGVTLTQFYAMTVNNLGQIIGSAWDHEYSHGIPVIWNPIPGGGWKIIRLDSSDYPYSEVLDINDRGEIVGYVATADWTALPALWRPKRPSGETWNLTVLPTLSGLPQGWNPANGINDLGDIVGVSNDEYWNWFAARWSSNAPNSVQVLGFPGDWSIANKVNNNRIVTGGYGIGSNPEQAVAVKLQ